MFINMAPTCTRQGDEVTCVDLMTGRAPHRRFRLKVKTTFHLKSKPCISNHVRLRSAEYKQFSRHLQSVAFILKTLSFIFLHKISFMCSYYALSLIVLVYFYVNCHWESLESTLNLADSIIISFLGKIHHIQYFSELLFECF